MNGLDSFTRVYASELSGTGLVKVGLKDGTCRVITPTGACCDVIFIAGVLLEIEGRADDRMQARVADPTGAFTLEAGRQERDVAGILSTLQPPVFVTALAEIQCPGGSGGSPWRCVLQDIREVSREVRDTWVVTTAEQTLSRLEAIYYALEHGNGPEPIMEAIGFYGITHKDLKETASTIRDLLAGMNNAPGVEETDITQVVLALIRDHGGEKGITLEEIVRIGSGEGLSPGEVRKAVEALLAEDECYQPSKGTIRLL
jgi:RPA family protein